MRRFWLAPRAVGPPRKQKGPPQRPISASFEARFRSSCQGSAVVGARGRLARRCSRRDKAAEVYPEPIHNPYPATLLEDRRERDRSDGFAIRAPAARARECLCQRGGVCARACRPERPSRSQQPPHALGLSGSGAGSDHAPRFLRARSTTHRSSSTPARPSVRSAGLSAAPPPAFARPVARERFDPVLVRAARAGRRGREVPGAHAARPCRKAWIDRVGSSPPGGR